MIAQNNPDAEQEPLQYKFRDWNDADRIWRWAPFFKPYEFRDRKVGSILIDCAFMDWLVEVRVELDEPMIISSGFRTRNQQELITKRRRSAHSDGQAADVLCFANLAERLERIAISKGVLGRGINQVGPIEQRYLHLDRWTLAPAGKRPALWSY